MTTDWRSTAACRNADIDAFFPDLSVGQPRSDVYDDALAICATCPHAGLYGPCVAEGYEQGHVGGVRGGMRPDELTKVYKRWRRDGRPRRPVTPQREQAERRRGEARRMAGQGVRASVIGDALGITERQVNRYLREGAA